MERAEKSELSWEEFVDNAGGKLKYATGQQGKN
jgi:hypothetical protein